MPLKPVTVTQLNEYLARSLATDPLLSAVRVTGEVSNLNYNKSGHVYFTLLDERSRLRVFLPRDIAEGLPFRIADGEKLLLTGRINVYVPGGSYSLVVREIEKQGAGALTEAFEKLKRKLAAEGLFDPARKKALPFFPDVVGIVTSETGAALQDIMKNIRARNGHVHVLLYPVPVQGEGAAVRIAEAIGRMNREHPEVDVMIVGRGGGSAEDLAAFNEESVARAISASEIPVISAVGHEIDFSIADMAADVRAETPTKAGVIAVPDLRELSAQVDRYRHDMVRALENGLNYAKLRTEAVRDQLSRSADERLRSAQDRLEQAKLTLTLQDPRRILASGYAMVEKDGHVAGGAKDLAAGDRVRILFHDGSAEAAITETTVQPETKR